MAINYSSIKSDSFNESDLSVNSLTVNSAGTTSLQAGSDLTLDAVNRVAVTATPFRLAQMTVIERDAIAVPQNGDMIYNTDTNKFQGYANGIWIDLH